MKKRIISLVLVVVLSLLALTSCGYSFVNDDMKNYATFDEAKFTEALSKLVIEDADFGTDEEARLQKVEDAIYTTLAGFVDADEKKTEGAPSKYDVYHYCYYATFEKDGETIYVLASYMKEASATKLQLGLSSNKDLAGKVAETVKELDIKDIAYATSTTGTTKKDDVLNVSYKKSYTEKVTDDKGNTTDKSVTVTVTNEFLTATAPADAEADKVFTDHLVGLTVGTKKTDSVVVYEDINGDGTVDKDTEKVTYSNVTANWIVNSGMNETYGSTVTVKDKTYTDTKKVTDIYGNSQDLKDVELTYHIFPVYFLEVEEDLTATVILKDIIGSAITASTDTNKDGKIDEDEKTASLDVFDEAYKNGDKTVADIIGELKELYTALDELETKLEEADKAVENAEKAIEEAKEADKEVSDTLNKNLETAKTNQTKAKDAVDKKEAEIDGKIALIVGATKDGKGIADEIVKQYREQRYEGLENTYKSTIKTNLAKEIYKIAKECITYKTDENGRIILPWDAVNEAYDILVNNYKYDFYEGTTTVSGSSSSVSNYTANGGDFEKFLKSELSLKTTDPMQKVYDAIGAQAEEAVKEKILVYALADAINAKLGGEIAASDEDIKTYKDQVEYYIYIYQYIGYEQYHGMTADDMSKSDYETVVTFDEALNHLLEEKAEDDYTPDEEHDNNKVQYVRISYTFKAADEDEADEK